MKLVPITKWSELELILWKLDMDLCFMYFVDLHSSIEVGGNECLG